MSVELGPDLYTLAQRVRIGARLLDRTEPEWFWQVSPALLDLESCVYCVSGQAFGDYRCGLARLLPNVPEIDKGRDDLAYYVLGLGADTYEDQCALEDLWTTAIERRRRADKAGRTRRGLMYWRHEHVQAYREWLAGRTR